MIAMQKHEAIGRTDLTTMKTFFFGGTKVPLGSAAEFNKHFPDGVALAGLGMTEIAGIHAFCQTKYTEKDTAGQFGINVVAKIVDEKGERCGVNVDGELCLKTLYPFFGYYNNAEATKESFDAEGFLKSGDICHFDEDGDLFVVDREKDMIRYGPVQIKPSEIEALLIRSPKIAEVCVIPIPDCIAIELPAAVVVRKNGYKISAQTIYDMVAGNWSACYSNHYRVIIWFYGVDALQTVWPINLSYEVEFISWTNYP